MTDASKYHLRVTAGPSYDPSTHKLVRVNQPQPTHVSSSHITADLNVRIQNYRGLPQDAPKTSPYFSDPHHTASLYSIAFRFTLKEDISAADLLFGNDFDKPIRDRIPPGFSAAFRLVRWAIDPGLTGDVYADNPWLYGPLASSINVLRVGGKGEQERSSGEEDVIEEGADGEEAEEIRQDAGLPADGAKRMKHFLDAKHRADWTFEGGREYACDFFNPYLDFNDLSLRLPGITLQLMRFWDGQPLRYVLKHKTADGKTDQELFVIVFTLVPEEELEKEVEKWEGGGGGVDGGGASKGEEEANATKGDFADEGVD